MTISTDRVRLDKWLWVARFFKTRSLAADAVDRGRVEVNGQVAKASRELRPGDQLLLRTDGGVRRELTVLALSLQRGPAPVAQSLYRESAQSVAAREEAALQRRLAPDPGLSIEQGRPTKRDRRTIARTQVAWQRWSASIDDTTD